MQKVFDSIKLIVELVPGTRAKRLARLKDSAEQYLRLRKDFGDISKWDARIEVFANSVAFSNGRLIERQYIEFAETFAEPEQVLLLHSEICNYLDIDWSNQSECIKIKPGFSTHEKRESLERFFTTLFPIAGAVLFGLISQIAYSSSSIWLLGISIAILCFTPIAVSRLSNKLSALHKFDLLLKSKTFKNQNTDLHQALIND